MYHTGEAEYEPIELPDRFDYGEAETLERAQSFLEFMRKRHTVRDYSNRPVPQEVIEQCIATAGTAPSGANHQPWHFVAISDPELKAMVRSAAEKEEDKFYDGGAGDAWLKALEPIGTDKHKPHLTDAPWLIVVFAQRYGRLETGERYKNYYVPESVGIATGFLLAALHNAGLVSLTHTPNPMKFLNDTCDRPDSEKAVMIVAVGYPAENAQVPAVAKVKKPLDQIMSVVSSED